MVGAYSELLADVARNTGKMWVHIAGNILDTAESYEIKLRTAAEKKSNNSEIIAKLNTAKSALDSAQNSVSPAKTSYEQVKVPGTPLIKFAEGNKNLRSAQKSLKTAQQNMTEAFQLIIK